MRLLLRGCTCEEDQKDKEFECKCLKIGGHLEAVKWMLWPRKYTPSPGFMGLRDWRQDMYIWLHYVESNDGRLADDDVLRHTPSRYWSIHDVQRYFLGDVHCEKGLFTYQYPNLRMPTRLGSYFWKSNIATKGHNTEYRKELHRSIMMSLLKTECSQRQMSKFILSDQLFNINKFDRHNRSSFLRIARNIFSCQDNLQLVSLENLCCKRMEGVELIQYLASFNAETLKYLFLWRFVSSYENPILINYSYITGSGQYIPRPDTRHCFIRSLCELRHLRILALEYAHIADTSGSALISLLPVINKPHFRLQLICRENQVPGKADVGLGAGGHVIPDTAWKTVSIVCPDLYVFMAFSRIRDYDDVRRFLTPSIPLRETHLEYGVDLMMRQRQDSDVSCFMRHIAFRYADTLVTLSVHQWRFAKFPLRRVFELLPQLTRFFYVGQVEDEVDLRRMLTMLACSVCDKLKQVHIQIQDDESKREYWRDVVIALSEEFAGVMDLYDISFCLNVYKS